MDTSVRFVPAAVPVVTDRISYIHRSFLIIGPLRDNR